MSEYIRNPTSTIFITFLSGSRKVQDRILMEEKQKGRKAERKKGLRENEMKRVSEHIKSKLMIYK